MKKIIIIFTLLLSICLMSQESTIVRLPDNVIGTYYLHGISKDGGNNYVRESTPSVFFIMTSPLFAFFNGSYLKVDKIIKSIQVKNGITSTYYVVTFKKNTKQMWVITRLNRNLMQIQIITRKTFKEEQRFLCRVYQK